MRKTYQFRAYPNKNSEVNSIRTLSTCRYLYNYSLAERKRQAECAGKIVEFVNPKGTSQTCICGFSVPKDLSVRIHICPSCGLVMGRDQVSAILTHLLQIPIKS